MASTKKIIVKGLDGANQEVDIYAADSDKLGGQEPAYYKQSRSCRFVVGTSAAGWTAADVDYLCDGTDDQVEINAAINALPAEGREIVLLDGIYNITDSIKINKANVSIVGNNKKTILKRMWDSVASNNGIIIIT